MHKSTTTRCALYTLAWFVSVLIGACGGGSDASPAAAPAAVLPVTGASGASGATVSASGTVFLGDGSKFTPQATGFKVFVGTSSVSYLFYRETDRQVGAGTTTEFEKIVVSREFSGFHTVEYTKGPVGSPPLLLRCEIDCGISFSPETGGAHPVSVVFNASQLGAAGAGLTLNGTLVGEAIGALWSPFELPRTTTGTLSLNGSVYAVIEATNASTATTGTVFTLNLADGSFISVNQAASGGASVHRSLTESYSPSRELFQYCSSACGVTITRSGSGYTLTFAATALATLSNTTLTVSSVPVILSGTFTIAGPTQGSLASGTAALADFTPLADHVFAANDELTYSFFDSVPGNTQLSVVTRGGVVFAVWLWRFSDDAFFGCMADATARGLPACTSITVSADGRTLSFAGTALRSESLAVTVRLTGTLVAKGL